MKEIGYEFRDRALLERALTTPACRMDRPGVEDNQRLEFLGDAVLGLLAADILYSKCPRSPEGEMTVRRSGMVSTAALCRAAERVGLPGKLRRNKGAEPLPEGAKTVADAVEAIAGAAWLDGGLDAARRVFDALGLAEEVSSGAVCNPKGELQMRSQALVPPVAPEYTLLSTSGKAHAPVFTVRVSVPGVGGAEASAHSRKEAEALAAAKLLSMNLV